MTNLLQIKSIKNSISLTFIRLISIVVLVSLMSVQVFAQPHVSCGGSITPKNKGTIIPLGGTYPQYTDTVHKGQIVYWQFNATNGSHYVFSNCYGVTGAHHENTFLGIYKASSPFALQTSNDDYGPLCPTDTNASIYWTCTASGTYDILLAHTGCDALDTTQAISYQLCIDPNAPP